MSRRVRQSGAHKRDGEREWPRRTGCRAIVRFPIRTRTPAQTYEAGLKERIVVIEFDSVDAARKAHDSEGYQAALKVFNNAAERDFRIVEGLE